MILLFHFGSAGGYWELLSLYSLSFSSSSFYSVRVHECICGVPSQYEVLCGLISSSYCNFDITPFPPRMLLACIECNGRSFLSRPFGLALRQSQLLYIDY